MVCVVCVVCVVVVAYGVCGVGYVGWVGRVGSGLWGSLYKGVRDSCVMLTISRAFLSAMLPPHTPCGVLS